MKLQTLLFSVLMIASCALARAESSKQTYVIVHGAWGGGWAFKEVDQLLSSNGHRVYRPTLSGLGERSHLRAAEIHLATHIDDIVNFLVWNELRDVVLVGHSYGGMVITGVADRVPDRIKRLVYLDAMVPNDGESWAGLLPNLPAGVEIRDSMLVPPWLKPGTPPPSDVPHPANTRTDKISLTNPLREKLPVTYILTADDDTKPEVDGFYPFYLRAKERHWDALIMRGDHNVHWSHPKELVALLEAAGAKTAK